MKIFKLMTLFLMLNSSLFGEIHEGKFQYTTNCHFVMNSFDADIYVKYKLWTLFGEPVIDVVARYEFGMFIDIDGEKYFMSDLPKKIVDKVKIYDLKIRVPFETNGAILTNYTVYIDVDMGVFGKVNEWSFNTPESPKWDKWIYTYQSNRKEYLLKKEAIDGYKNFVRLAYYSDSSSVGFYTNGIIIKSIKYDVTPLKKYLRNKKLKEKRESLKKNYKNETDALNKEKKELYEEQQSLSKRLKERYGNEPLSSVIRRAKIENNKEVLEHFMKASKESEKLRVKENLLFEKIERIYTQYSNKLKKYEEEHAHALDEIERESQEIGYFIEEKRAEIENRELPQKAEATEDVWVDNETQLMWQDNEMAKTNKRSWYTAIDYCDALALGSYDNWRLPTKRELKSLYLKKNNLKNLDDGISDYWSSSTVKDYEYNAWIVFFYDGDVYGYVKDGSSYVRCVRDGQ